MEPYLTYLTPPLLGGLIGYMTNHVAIRMLFRPLKPWRILGLKVPMTPGVIPSKRHDLARNIGKMVGHHLLTSKEISKAIKSDKFNNELESVIAGRVSDILQKDLGPLPTIIPERFQSYFNVGVKILKSRTLKYIHNHLDSDQFATGLAESILTHLEEFLQKDINSILPSARQEEIFSFINKTIRNLLENPETGKWISIYIDNKFDEILTKQKALNDIFPEELITLISQKIEEETPNLLAKAGKMIQEPVMQDRIARGICSAIDNFIAALGPMAALASSFLSPEVIDQKVREYLESKGGEISDWMIDETVQQKITVIIREKIQELSSTPIAILLKDIDPQKLVEIKAKLSNQITALIQKPNIADSITTIAKAAIQTQIDRSLHDFLNDLFSEKGVKSGQEWTAEEMINVLRSRKVKRILDKIVLDLIDTNLLKRQIGPLANLIPQKIQKGFCEYLMQITGELLIREVPGLVDSLNIENIVSKKVDSLDLLRLEGLLMGIMQEQFKYINLFGGLLGFLIGLCNLLLFI